jgi:uncharacterized protein YgiM (DUF1202 family)
MAVLTGATATPSPTAFEFSSLIEPGSSVRPSVQSSVTATWVPVFAVVINSDGVNLREGPGLSFGYKVTVAAKSRVEVLGISADGQWVYIRGNAGEEEYSGWLFVPLVTLEGPIDELPVLE